MSGKLWTGAEPGNILRWVSRNPNPHGLGMASSNRHAALVTGKDENGTLSAICVVRAESMKMRPGVPVVPLDDDGLEGFVAVPSEKFTVTPRSYYDRGMYEAGSVSDGTLDKVTDAGAPKKKSALDRMREQMPDGSGQNGAAHDGPEI